jgi:hypothetical protein
MSFLKLDTRPQSAPVLPEGAYKLTCTNAMYTLRNKELDVSQDNVKGLLCSFQFKANGATGEVMHNFNLFHENDSTRRIAVEDFGVMCKAFGFAIDESGYPVNEEGEIVEPKDMKHRQLNAHIIVKPHWQNPDNMQNVVKVWLMPKDSAVKQDAKPADDEFNDDIPF